MINFNNIFDVSLSCENQDIFSIEDYNTSISKELKEILSNYNTNSTDKLISENDLSAIKSKFKLSFGKQLQEYILNCGYLGYEGVEFYGINANQMENSDLVTQTLYLRKYFSLSSNYTTIENCGEGLYALVDKNDNVYLLYTEENKPLTNTKKKFYDYIKYRFDTQNIHAYNAEWKYVKPLKDPKSIDKFESEHGVKLPKDLKEIILKYNGGRPPKRYFDVGKEKDIEFKTLLSFNKDDVETIFDISLDSEDKSLIPFASTSGGDYICLKSNKIYFWRQDTDKSILLAPTFTKFLDTLNDGGVNSNEGWVKILGTKDYYHKKGEDWFEDGISKSPWYEADFPNKVRKIFIDAVKKTITTSNIIDLKDLVTESGNNCYYTIRISVGVSIKNNIPINQVKTKLKPVIKNIIELTTKTYCKPLKWELEEELSFHALYVEDGLIETSISISLPTIFFTQFKSHYSIKNGGYNNGD